MESKPELMTPKEAAQFLRRPVSALERWRCEGTGPAYIKVGRNVLYPRKRIEEYIQQNTHEPSVRANVAEV